MICRSVKPRNPIYLVSIALRWKLAKALCVWVGCQQGRGASDGASAAEQRKRDIKLKSEENVHLSKNPLRARAYYALVAKLRRLYFVDQACKSRIGSVRWPIILFLCCIKRPTLDTKGHHLHFQAWTLGGAIFFVLGTHANDGGTKVSPSHSTRDSNAF